MEVWNYLSARAHWALELLYSGRATHRGGRSASQTDELGRAHMSGEPGLKALNVNTSRQPVEHGLRVCDTRVFLLSVEIDVAPEEQRRER